MCRLLGLQAEQPIDITPWIEAFSDRCKESEEYQGHGWGVSWRSESGWRHYRSVEPIWENRLEIEIPPTNLAIVHARSAFRDEGIVVENNMPFASDELVFAFNGELHGVRLSAPGATGAARLFNLLKRFNGVWGGDTLAALTRLDRLIATRSKYVKALNLLVSDGQSLFVSTRYSENPDYFTVHVGSVPDGSGLQLVCSERISTGAQTPDWESLPNGSNRAVGDEAVCSS